MHLALAANGQGVALWTGGNGVQAATLSPGGTWTAPVILAPSTSTVASGLAADGTGNAVALLTLNVDIGSTITWVPETSAIPSAAAGTAPAQLATLSGRNGKSPAPGRLVFEDAGSAVTSPPGQGFGAPANLPPAPSRSPPPPATHSPSGPPAPT